MAGLVRDGPDPAGARVMHGEPRGRGAGARHDRDEAAAHLYDKGERTVQQIADLFGVPRTTVYGHLDPASTGRRPALRRASHLTGASTS